jgi:hypothetical protein
MVDEAVTLPFGGRTVLPVEVCAPTLTDGHAWLTMDGARHRRRC